MSLDLTEAVELALDETYLARIGGTGDDFAGVVEQAVTLAAPLIAAQVREQIAREIEAEAETYGSQSAVDTFRIAARIARTAVTR